jgi:hypothetical protein
MESQPSPLRKYCRRVAQKQFFVMVITDAPDAGAGVAGAG